MLCKPMKAHNKEINVLMVTLPYQGHINPMLRFAQLLTSKDIHVTLCTTEHARKHQLIDRLNKSNNLVDFEFFEDGLSPELDRDKNIDILLEDCLPRDGANNLSKLIHTLESNGRSFSCIINNCFVPWVANVATTQNIPCAMLWIQSCATYAIYYYYHKRLFDFPSLSNPNDKVTIPGLSSLKVEDLPTFILPSIPNHFRNIISSTINSLDICQWVFGSSFYELEESLIEPMSQFKPILPIGPLVPPIMLQNTRNVDYQEGSKSEDPCMDWLNMQPVSSVLYIALGSISVLSQNETRSLAMALENDANRRFLWVMKKGEEGWGRQGGELPNGFLDKTKERGLVVSWCQQDKVLKHPAIQCFLTHCGWNSTLEAITAGVPIIAFPDWTDQVTNAKLLVDVFKVGVRMKKCSNGELSKEEVEKCILEVTQGPKATTIKEHAIFFKEEARKATSIGGSSYLNIDNFVCELRGKS